MGNIQFRGHNFVGPLSIYNGSTLEPVTILEILYAAVTYGYPTIGPIPFYEAMKRIFTIFAAIEDDNGVYIKTITYQNSDPTEKAFISYVLGMTFCNLVARSKLNFDYILHYDLITSSPTFNISSNLSSNSRPDFIGFKYITPHDYLVIEAKGTSSNYNPVTTIKGKSQVNQIYSINGNPPLRVVVQTYFNNNIHIHYEDPKADNHIQINFEGDLYKVYLKSLRRIFITAPVLDEMIFGDHLFKGIKISGTPYFLGILNEVYSSEEVSFEHVKNIKKQINNVVTNEDYYLGVDGILVKTINYEE